MYLKIKILLAFSFMTLAYGASAQQPPPNIHVSGTGAIMVEPDIAYMTFSVEKINASIQEAQEDVVDVVEDVLSLTDSLGIERKQVNAAQPIIRPEYKAQSKFSSTNGRELSGYFVARQITVQLNDLTKLGGFIEGAIELGINNLSPPTLDSTERAKYSKQALALAAKDAKAQAEVVAEALGEAIKGVLSLHVQNTGHVLRSEAFVGRKSRNMSFSSAQAAETYSAGQIEIKATVQAQFSLQQ